MKKTCVDLHANLTFAKVSASLFKSTQVHARPDQIKSQVDPSFELVSTVHASQFSQGLRVVLCYRGLP